jgi:hypothetical protein
VTGRRVDLSRVEGYEAAAMRLGPGDFGRDRAGTWFVRPPQNAEGRSIVGRLTTHGVVEHEDGAITVSPSIHQQYGSGETLWHGFLERGVWRSC